MLTVAIGIATAWFFPGATHWAVDPLRVEVVVALSLCLLAWGLQTRSLLRALARPWAALWSLVIGYGLVPILGWAAGQVLPSPDLRIGLIIIACVPCTLSSAVIWTRLAGGNDGMAMLIVVLSTGLSWLVTPLWLIFLTGTEATLDTGQMMRTLLLVLIVPVGLGQLTRFVPTLVTVATRGKTAFDVLTRLLVCVVIVKAAVGVADQRQDLYLLDSLLTLGLCLTTHLVALFAGYASGRLLGFAKKDSIAIAFGCSQKTLPVALVLAHFYQARYPLVVLPLVFYHVTQLIVDTLIADRWASRQASPSKEFPVS
jgi:sodium/bile acid cotransporter 7